MTFYWNGALLLTGALDDDQQAFILQYIFKKWLFNAQPTVRFVTINNRTSAILFDDYKEQQAAFIKEMNCLARFLRSTGHPVEEIRGDGDAIRGDNGNDSIYVDFEDGRFSLLSERETAIRSASEEALRRELARRRRKNEAKALATRPRMATGIVWNARKGVEADQLPSEVLVEGYDDIGAVYHLASEYGADVVALCLKEFGSEPNEEGHTKAPDAATGQLDQFLKASLRRMLEENPEARPLPVTEVLGENISMEKKEEIYAAQAHYLALWESVRNEIAADKANDIIS